MRQRVRSDVNWVGVGITCVIIMALVAAALYFNVFPGLKCQESGGVWIQNAWGLYSCVKGN